MKKYFLFSVVLLSAEFVWAQPGITKYPEPEFSNEVYYLKKDSVNVVIRLEKVSSKMETKAKLGGMAGSESGFALDGEKSSVRFGGGNNLSFVISTGAAAKSSSSLSDSIMKASGVDPSTMSGMMGSMNDPATTITLYKVETGNGKRKILMQKNGGAMPFASKKTQSSDKYTFSVKKIREGYWELVIDKPLSRGEYAFSKMDMMSMASMGTLLFAFGID